MLFKGLFVRPFEATARARSPLLAGDGALGLAQGGGPLALELLSLLGLLLPLGQDLGILGGGQPGGRNQ